MDIPEIKTHVFYGKRYKLVFGGIKENTSEEELKSVSERCEIPDINDIQALTDNRGTKNARMLIDLSSVADDRDLLRVLLDEGLHACDERIDNSVVDLYAKDLSSFLWRFGYRRIISVPSNMPLGDSHSSCTAEEE